MRFYVRGEGIENIVLQYKKFDSYCTIRSVLRVIFLFILNALALYTNLEVQNEGKKQNNDLIRNIIKCIAKI